MDKSIIKELNNLFKNVRENKTYKLDILENYRVLHLKENSLKALNDFGFTELKTTYISSKKYSEKVVDILLDALKQLGFKQV